MLIKTLDSPNGIVNGLVGTCVAHSEKILLFQTKTGKILPIPNENEITEFKPRNNVFYFECN
jgi:hypothetical protein